MKKADIKVGEEYRTSRGSTYSYDLKRVVVEAIGVHKAGDYTFQRKAEDEVGFTREWVRETRENRDLTPNQAEQLIRDRKRESEVLTAKLRQGNEWVKDGKGGGILVRVLDQKTGEDVPRKVYRNGEYVQVSKVCRCIVESREFDCTWAQHLVNVKTEAEYAEKQKVERDAREKQKAAELAVLRAALVTQPDVRVEFDRGYGYGAIQVAMTRESLAVLLGVELPKEGD